MSITKPAHYHAGNVDVIKFSEENFSKEELKGFYRINVLKYLARYDKKDMLNDLQKAQFYLDKLTTLEIHDQSTKEQIDVHNIKAEQKRAIDTFMGGVNPND